MDGGFTDAEFLRGGADRGPVLYDVKSQALGPLLHISFQHTTLPASCWSILCGAWAGYVHPGAFLRTRGRILRRFR